LDYQPSHIQCGVGCVLLRFRLPVSLQSDVIQGISAPVLYSESPTEFIVIAAIMGGRLGLGFALVLLLSIAKL